MQSGLSSHITNIAVRLNWTAPQYHTTTVSTTAENRTKLEGKMVSDCSQTKWQFPYKFAENSMFGITFDILHPVGIFLVSFLLSQNIIYTKNIYILFYIYM